jgi:hypothetical protein
MEIFRVLGLLSEAQSKLRLTLFKNQVLALITQIIHLIF